jgi:hypothetical protein
MILVLLVTIPLCVALGYAVAIYGRLGKIKQHLRGHTDRLQREVMVATLLEGPRYADPRHLCLFEGQVYSQHGEDGILSEILRRIGETDRRFVEIGAGDGMENNTLYRLSLGWSGHWFEGDPANIERIRKTLGAEIADKRLHVVQALMTAENVAGLMVEHGVPKAFDVLSIDIDYNTSHLWRALKDLTPRVVIVEYNASIPRDDDWEVEYRADAVWDHSLYFGASLKRLELLGQSLGYALVACDLSGTNAFFVRADLVDHQFVGPFHATAMYEPPRYYLVGSSGHARRYGRAARTAPGV